MRKLFFLCFVLSLFLLLPAPIIWAQTISTQKGLTTATFNTSAGIVKIYLPDDLRPGDMISGSIIAEAVGKNAKQMGNNLSSLSKYSVSIGGNTFPVTKQGSFKWTVPVSKQQSAAIRLINAAGVTTGQLPVQFNMSQQATVASSGCVIPSHVMTGSPVNIPGSFDGDASNTKCTVGGTAVTVLAESPRQSIVQYPSEATGSQTLSIGEGKGNSSPSCQQRISGVHLDVSAGKLNLVRGEKTYIDVKITGLDNLRDTAKLTLINMSPTTVTMMPANMIVIPLPPAGVSSGTFTRRFDIQSLRTGDFTVNVDLDLKDNPGPGNMYDIKYEKNESGLPGSYGYIGDQPCNPEGGTTWNRWHKTFICQIDDRKVLPCGHSKEGNDVYEKLKELLEELELDKATDIGEKMAKAFSTAKTFSYSIHVIRKWVEYDIQYKCVNGKWQPIGGVYVKIGTDDLGWHSVKHPTTECWMTFDSPAAEKEFEEALENALRNACR